MHRHSSEIIVAIVAFVSTILGATIGAVTNYILAVKREKADRDRDERIHEIEIKRAARLMSLELEKAYALAELAIKKRYWVPDARVSTDVWQKYGSTIAPDLSYLDWRAVATAFMALEHINGTMALYLSGPLRDQPISDQSIGGVDIMQRDVKRGIESLLNTSEAARMAESSK